MKISLFQGVLFGVFGLAAVIGLFVFATHTSNTSSSSSSATTVGTVVIWGTLPKTDILNALAAIGQTDQTLKDVSYVQKNENTLPGDLASAIATGNPPDLILASQEVLQPLTRYIAPIPFTMLPASSFTATFVGEGNLFTEPSGAGYYGVPFLVDPLVLYSNRAILSSDGIAKPPATWEALTGLVPSVAIVTTSKQVSRELIGLGAYDNVHNARAILSSLFLQTGVPITSYQNGTLSANMSGSAADGSIPGQAVLGFYTQFADPSKVSYTWNTSLKDSQQAFLAGDAALYIGYASEARFLSSANPNLDFVVSPLPQPATAQLKTAYGRIYAFMVPRAAKNASGAYQAAVLLSGSAKQLIAAAATGLAPATLTPLATLPSDPVAAVAYAEALYTKGWLSPAPLDTDKVFSSMITSVISGRQLPTGALSSGETALNSVLR